LNDPRLPAADKLWLMAQSPTVISADSTNSYEAIRYGAAWKDRRFRMAVFTAMQLVFFLILFVFAFLSAIRLDPGINPFPLFLLWFLIYLHTAIWLNRFRCPRCGQFYYRKPLRQGPQNSHACRHCGVLEDSGPSPQVDHLSNASERGLFAQPIVRKGFLHQLLFPGILLIAWIASVNIELIRSEVYQDCLAKALASQEVQNALGTKIWVSYPVLGFETAIGPAHFAEWSLSLIGSRGTGHLYGVATRVNGTWDVSRLVFVPERRNRKIDLTPVHKLSPEQVPHKSVYLVPIGLADSESMDWAPAFYKAKLGIDLELLPSIPLDSRLIDASRKQLNADRVIEFLEAAHPEFTRDPAAIVIGITSRDMYIPGFPRRFAENCRGAGHYAVISSAHLHPPKLLGDWNPEWLMSRVEKLLTKNLAILYFGLPMSNDYTSLLSIGVLSGSEIDEIGGQIIGAKGVWDPFPAPGSPTVTIYDSPGRQQLWKMSDEGAPPDTKSQVFLADLSLGLFTQRKADFVFEDEPALQFTRVYRNQDDRSRSFGIGGSNNFDIFLGGQMGTAVDLILEDGARIHFKHQAPKPGQVGDNISGRLGRRLPI
jgi:predicted Zn-dependent protease